MADFVFVSFWPRDANNRDIYELHGAESELKYPREAPTDGYRNTPIRLGMNVKDGIDERPRAGEHPHGYIMGLRTVASDSGEIESAIYVRVVHRDIRRINDKRRLHNPITIEASPRFQRELDAVAFINIPHYLNPEINDRRLEFDRKNNLADDVLPEPQNILP